MKKHELPVLHHHDDHEHSHSHSHEHIHADGTVHSHEHDHSHSHGDMVGHEHSHHDCDHDHDCHSCGGCDPMAEAVALMDYMVKHNTAHAGELAELGKKLGELGNTVAEKQVMEAVSEFEKANMRLSVVLASLK